MQFVLGRLKFVYKGNWATATSYIADDIVTYGGRSYVCVTNHTSNASTSGFYSDSSYWHLINDGIANRGSWSTTTYYKINDIVKYGAKIYIATTGHTSNSVSNGGFYSDSSNWQLLNDGVENKSSWSTSTYYKLNDTVKYGGRTYISTNGHLSNATSSGGFYSDIGSWQLLNDGFENKGNWSSGTYYKINDVVKWGSSLYICNTGHTAGSAWVDTEANFTLFVGGLEFENNWANTTLYQTGDVVRYGGYQFIATNESTNILPTNTSFWNTLSTGFTVQGQYNNATTYKPGDVVQFGGYVYAARLDTVGVLPSNTTNWDLVNYGSKWNESWASNTTYYKGDTVRYGGSSYISVTHNNSNNEPDPANTSQWNLIAQGSNNFYQMTNTGDMVYLDVGGVNNLGIGTTGYVLTANSTSRPEWKLNDAVQLGGIAAASYQLNSTLAANVAGLTANNSNNLGSIAAASYQLNSTLAANVAGLTANNSSNLGGVAAASYQLNSTLAANVAGLTANNTTNLGGIAASNYTTTGKAIAMAIVFGG